MKHTLKECTMLWCYYAKLGLSGDNSKMRDTGDRDNDKDDGFPKVHNAFMIFGGPSACLTACQRKREHQEVFSVEAATP